MEIQQLWLDHIRHKSQYFPREFGKTRKLCVNFRQYRQFIEKAEGKDCYISIYGYASEFIKRYREKNKPYAETVVLDTIYFDFDSERNLMLALADVRRILTALTDPVRVYFTGCKGAAVYIDLPKLKLKYPKETLADFSRSLARKLRLETADFHVFGDVARISRIPGTINTASRRRWGAELYCTPLTQEEIFGALNELDIVKVGRKNPQDRRIEVALSDKIAQELYEIDGEMEEKVRVRELYRECLKIKSIKPRTDSLAEKLIANAGAITDGRRRILVYLLIPRLKHLGENEIEMRCRQFVEGSGGSWRNYKTYVHASIRRTLEMDWAPWRLETFIEKNPDLSGVMGDLK